MIGRIGLAAAVLLSGPAARAQEEAFRTPEKATVYTLGSTRAVVEEARVLPHVESDYTRRFHFDSFDNPKLKELRKRYQLDEVIAPGKDEFDRQVRLNDWTHRQFKKFGRPSANPRGAIKILEAIEEGHTFFCAYYAEVLVSASASLGWVNRQLCLRRHQGNARNGSSEHATTETWSNQYGKWVMFDPTTNMYLEKDGVPLSGFEIRQEWFYREGKDLVFVIGKDRRRYTKGDLPVILGRFEGFGNLSLDPDELDKYGFIGYVPNTDLMDRGEDYAKMFITKDALCDGQKWHVRKNPADPAKDPYFPIGQAAISLSAEGDGLCVSLRTMTPNFREYQVRKNGGVWKKSGESLIWKVGPGIHRLEARTVNRFGVKGYVSHVTVSVSERE